jgi:hypothetical protein
VCRLPFGRWKVSKKNGVQEAPPTPVSRASNQLNSTAVSSLALGDPDLFRTGQFACSEPSAAAHRQTTGCTRRRSGRIVAFDTSIRSEFQSNRRTAARLANRPPESREFARANGKGVPVRKIRLADLLRQAQQVRKVFARAAAGQAEPELETGRSSNRRFRLQRSHVDHEAILDVLVEHALPGLIDLLNGNYLNVSRESMLGAEIQHFLSLCNAPD